MDTEIWRKLKEAHPFPDIEGVPEYQIDLDGGGRDLIDALIFNEGAKYVLEIGCFLNGSVKRWLSRHASLCVVGVDPWDEGIIELLESDIRDRHMIPYYNKVGDRRGFVASIRDIGVFRAACAVLRDYQERFVPVQGLSPDSLVALKEYGFTPDVIYIDADKKKEDLYVAHDLWPQAIITGDDWTWAAEQDFPMQKNVRDFANDRDLEVFATKATWITRARR